ncbi:MAG: dockerin type I repeat-containing protein [candidate division Zixibacteria bacterium]|nr:dockerin type I repeat-containing protein [candidate division Zixibacteria bacterium]
MCHKSKILLIIVLVFSLLFLFSEFGLANNEYYPVGIDLTTPPCSDAGTVEIDMMVNIDSFIAAFICPIEVTGTANPVLDTILTGGLSSSNPPAFYPPSVVNIPSPPWASKLVNPYHGFLPDMYLFSAWAVIEPLIPPVKNGLFCRMFFKVDGPGTIVIEGACWVSDCMSIISASGPVPITWNGPYTFNVSRQHGDASGDCKLSVSDVVYLINYLFKGGPRPDPLWQGDVNCDNDVNILDVVYLVRYLFMGGTPPC